MQGVHERLGRAMSVVIGDAGFAATFARCVMYARAECPALAEVDPDALLDRLWACLGRLSPAAIRAIGVTLVARYFELMSRFVGPEVTLRLFYNAWPEALPSTLELLEKS
ncbi:MAG: hypothetical protein M3Y87_04825 [Myxococcota bacterium]|nr:hypothetical protein [Myxococcota bacterium]